MELGVDLGIAPYGTEALGIMRIEKGHIAGNEINGTTTAADLGFGRMMSNKKDYIGRVLAAREGLTDPQRQALVGVKPVDRSERFQAGAHFLEVNAKATLNNDQGYLTSVAFSPMLNHWIGLGLLRGGPKRLGERLRAYDTLRNSDVEVEVVSPVFFDPDGVRLKS
jgi:sarcosine oxidase subunit alpha